MNKHLGVLLAIVAVLPATSHAQRVDVRLAWPAGKESEAIQGGSSLPVVLEALRSDARLDAQREPVSEQELVVIGLDARGNERYRQVVHDPARVRGEVFDPITGQFETRHDIRQAADELRIALPVDPTVRRLRIYRPRFNERGYTLELATELDFPQNVASETRTVQLEAAVAGATVINNGDPANRVDIVFLGDGYTAAELGKYAQDVNNVIGSFFEVEPYKTYSSFFNVHRVDVVSSQSGVSHPELGVQRNTALGASYDCNGIQRLICADPAKASNAAAAVLPANARDILVVLVNDTQYGGSGGSVAVISTNPSSVFLALHETGHSFGLLADEYTSNPELCKLSEPREPNSTTILNRRTTKWAQWIAASTPIPTPTTLGSTPGLYLGSRYCVTGMYRPTNDSMMRTLGVPFFAINEEALIKRLYVFTRPIDSFSPTASSLSMSGTQTQTFSITTPPTPGNTLAVGWYLDSEFMATGNSFTLSTRGVHQGTHTLTAVARDTTNRVRKDTNNSLSQTQKWTITVGR